MAWNWHKIKTYGKLTGILLIILIVLMFILSNRDPITVKFLWKDLVTMDLYFFIIIVAVMGILVFLVAKKIRKVIIDLRMILREQKEQKKLVNDISQKINKKE